MNLCVRPLILLLLIIVGNTLLTNAQSEARGDSVKKAASGVINGKVTIKGKGASGITVVLIADGARGDDSLQQRVTTDEDGNYQISNVAPGGYKVLPTAPTFVLTGETSLSQYRRLFGSSGKAVIVADREIVQNVDFALTPGGVVTGKVTDSEGHPLIEQQVNLYPVIGKDPASRDYQSMPRTSATDDRGIYRIFGVPKGRYVVSVGRVQDGLFDGGPRNQSYRQTFHPASTDAAKATIVEVSEGSESTSIDITVNTEPTSNTFSLSGRIVDGSSGQPLANATLALKITTRNKSNSMTSSDWGSNQKGEFKFENLAPAKYSIYLEPQLNTDFRSDPVLVEVIDQDVTGLVVKAVRGASVSGVVVFEPGDAKSASPPFGQLFVQSYLEPASGDGGNGRSAFISRDGTFRISALEAGTAHFLVSPNGRSAIGIRIVRVEREGVVQPHGIEIKDGEAVTGVRLVVRTGNGSIRGIIRVENGELPLPPGLALWLSAPIEDTSNPLGAIMQAPQIDARGHFLITNLPAGNYEVNASVYGTNGRVSTKQQANVTNGAVTEVTLILNLKPN